MAIITSPNEIASLRQSGWILAQAVQAVVREVQPGVTTESLDRIAAGEIRRLGGQPSFLGFNGFPASLCTSVNQEVVHGIPSPYRVLKEGDIVGLDLGVVFEGMYTDHAVTVPVGNISKEAAQLIDDTKKSLQQGLKVVKAGARVGDIGAAMEGYLKPKGYGIVRQLTGHGVGRGVHEEPSIPNFGKAGTGPVLEAGMVLAIEPMVTLGSHAVGTHTDHWTVVTEDDSLSAHFEDTIIVTRNGCEIITTAHANHPRA